MFRMFVALVVLPSCIIGATLHSEDRLMRSEVPSHRSMQMSPHGEILQASRLIESTKAAKHKARDVDYCDYDFLMGVESSVNCTEDLAVKLEVLNATLNTTRNLLSHKLVLDREACIEAAEQHHAHTLGAVHMTLIFDEQERHPRGCYKASSCNESWNDICYFYNGVGSWPEPQRKGLSHVIGTPVCQRPKHTTGEKDTNGGCPTGYSVLDELVTCDAAANCLGYCKGGDAGTSNPEFIIGGYNGSKHLDYPRGCFVDNLDGCVYYNPESLMGTGTNVRGTPLCNVSEVVRYALPPAQNHTATPTGPLTPATVETTDDTTETTPST